MLESEYEGPVTVKLPDGCNNPEALTSATFTVNVPSTESPGAVAGNGSTYESERVIRICTCVAVPVELSATSVLASNL